MSSCSQPPSDDNPVPSLKITGNYDGCGIGTFIQDGMPNAAIISTYETIISREVSVVMWFLDWTYPFPTATCEIINAHGSVPMITWMPMKWADGTDETYSLENIIAGNCDSYISSFANSAKSWGKPVFLRWGHEMNGNWYNWSGYNNGSNEAAVAKYKEAWKRIYITFEALGANNVTWVWCPMNENIPDQPWNYADKYYPGNDYVDWVAFDGYSRQSNSFKSFDQIFSAIYSSFSSLYNKPIMIGEMSSATSEIHNKSSWITDAFIKLKSSSYSKIKLYIWFNQAKTESDGFCDWRADSLLAHKISFEAAMSDPYYLSTIH